MALQGRTAAFKAYMATRRGDILGIAKYSQQALDCLSEKDHSWRAIVAISSAIALQIKGEMIAATDMLYEAVATAMKAGNVYFYLTTRVGTPMDINPYSSGESPNVPDERR